MLEKIKKWDLMGRDIPISYIHWGGLMIQDFLPRNLYPRGKMNRHVCGFTKFVKIQTRAKKLQFFMMTQRMSRLMFCD